MAEQATFFPLATNQIDAEGKFADFIKLCQDQQVTDIATLINQNNYLYLLYAIFTDSPYLSRLLFRDVHFAKELFSQPLDVLFEKIIKKLLAKLPDEKDTGQVMKILRQSKSQIALIISFADLSGQWTLDKIMGSLTKFAEISVSLVVSHLLHIEIIKGNLAVPAHLRNRPPDQLRATPDMSKGTGYVVLAMGKMGGHELNYSSDIDLIVLYDNDIVQYTGRKTAQDMFIKLTRTLVKIMQERTAEGYVFRTDLRLRPDPGATAVALSMEGAEIYYQSMGLNWERAAMIKARPVAGDMAAGYEFLSRIKSFVWRKHLDYVALEDIYAIKKLIHQHHGHKEICFAGQDIKLGHGGIREIEFYAQIFQLIAGGREPELQVAPTCEALNALEKAGKLSEEDNQILQMAYGYYRRLEHRLQMINDDQTHVMPDSAEDLSRITSFMGYKDQHDFEKDLDHHLRNVHRLFTDLLKESHQDDEVDNQLLAFPADDYNEASLKVISEAGYEDPKVIYNIIQTWLLGRYRACRTERARKLLHGFVPEILRNFSRFGDPDSSFKRFDKFLSRLPSGVQLFSFIKAQPWLLELLSEIIGIAPNLADQLAKRPLLLDAVVNNDFFEASFNMEGLRAHLKDQLALAQDFQDILDISRKWASEHKFQVGVQILRNNIDARTVGKNLSMVADIILEVMLVEVKREFTRKHGVIEGAQFAIFALGKLGGRELTPTSDLDLVFIYDPRQAPPFSNGAKALSINHYFARLSQQFINALTAMTGEGKLYEIDMRLRPSGNAGPIAVTLQGFESYQQNDAWTWEHLALTRGRTIVADAEIKGKISEIVQTALKDSNRRNLLRDTADMREKLFNEFGTKDIWAVKHIRGGLVDIEFICQYLLLKYGAQFPEILVTNTLDQISLLKKHHVFSDYNGNMLYHGCDFMQNLQAVLRLSLGDEVRLSANQQGLIDTLCERFDVDTIGLLAQKVTEIQKKIYNIYREIIEYPAKKS